MSKRRSACGVWLESPRGKEKRAPPLDRPSRSSDCVRQEPAGDHEPGKATPLAVDPDHTPARPSGALVGLLALLPTWPCFSPASEVSSCDFCSGFSGSFQQLVPGKSLRSILGGRPATKLTSHGSSRSLPGTEPFGMKGRSGPCLTGPLRPPRPRSHQVGVPPPAPCRLPPGPGSPQVRVPPGPGSSQVPVAPGPGPPRPRTPSAGDTRSRPEGSIGRRRLTPGAAPSAASSSPRARSCRVSAAPRAPGRRP